MHLLGLRCRCCNEELSPFEVARYDELGGMKEDCYQESMDAAYDDLPSIFEEE